MSHLPCDLCQLLDMSKVIDIRIRLLASHTRLLLTDVSHRRRCTFVRHGVV